MAKKQTYGNDSIKSLKGADRVRLRPAVIFGSDGLDGCEHAIFEILSNSIDEARQGYGKEITVTRYADHSVEVEDHGRGIPVGYAFKRIWEGGHGTTSQHYAGVAFDVGQSTTAANRRKIYKAAARTGAWGYVEPLSMTPTWVHFDRRYGKPACRSTTAGYPTLRRGSRSTYVLILQDALNALGYSTNTLDGIFGKATENALKACQRRFSLTADGVCGCASWRKIAEATVGIGKTATVIDA